MYLSLAIRLTLPYGSSKEVATPQRGKVVESSLEGGGASPLPFIEYSLTTGSVVVSSCTYGILISNIMAANGSLRLFPR